jgi:phosphopantetheine adenylyltransferase
MNEFKDFLDDNGLLGNCLLELQKLGCESYEDLKFLTVEIVESLTINFVQKKKLTVLIEKAIAAADLENDQANVSLFYDIQSKLSSLLARSNI